MVRKARGRRGRGAWQTVGEASSAVLCLVLSGISKGEVTVGERGRGGGRSRRKGGKGREGGEDVVNGGGGGGEVGGGEVMAV